MDTFDKLMGAAEDTMDKLETATSPVEPSDDDGLEYEWKSASGPDKVWVFHAFRGNSPLCSKELSVIGDHPLKGGYVNACTKCMRLTCALAGDDE